MALFAKRLFQATSIFSFAAIAFAGDDLYSSDFLNCQRNATIVVNHASIAFSRTNATVTFDVSGTSTEEQKVRASLVVLAYGTQVYQREFDPCDNSTKISQLCPVPKGTFSAAGSQVVPSQYLNQIPSIAYSIPDIEGNATLTLVSEQGGRQIGCIQSGITNGRTLEMPQVANAAMGVAASVLALSGVSALASSGFVGAAPSSVGFATVLGWFQTIAVTGMMSVNYPPIYRSFSKNFAFSTGLVSWEPMQDTIDNFRGRTGGNLTNDNVHFLKNAALSFSDGDWETPTVFSRHPRRSPPRLEYYTRTISLTSSNSTNNSTSTNNQTQAEHVVHGIGAFAEELMIPQSNIFMTALLIFAIIVASITVGILLLKLLLEFWALYGSFPKRLTGFRTHYWTLLSKTIANLILLLYGVWVTWCIFQFSLGDSWAVKVVAAATLSVFTLILAGFAIRIVVLARRYKRADGDASALYENKETWEKYSVFYDSYKRSKWWIFMPFIFVSFCRGAILAGGNGHGLVQTTAQLTVETATFLFLLWNRPFATAAGNWINITIQVVRVLSFVCVLVFVEQLGIAQTTKTLTGVVLIVVQGVLTALLVVLIAVNGLIVMCKENPHRKRQKEAEKLRDAQEDLTSLSPHDSLLNRSNLTLHRSMPPLRQSVATTVVDLASVRHTRMRSEPLAIGAKNYPSVIVRERASLAQRGDLFGTVGWDQAQRMSWALGRPLDTRRPTLPMV